VSCRFATTVSIKNTLVQKRTHAWITSNTSKLGTIDCTVWKPGSVLTQSNEATSTYAYGCCFLLLNISDELHVMHWFTHHKSLQYRQCIPAFIYTVQNINTV